MAAFLAVYEEVFSVINLKRYEKKPRKNEKDMLT